MKEKCRKRWLDCFFHLGHILFTQTHLLPNGSLVGVKQQHKCPIKRNSSGVTCRLKSSVTQQETMHGWKSTESKDGAAAHLEARRSGEDC